MPLERVMGVVLAAGQGVRMKSSTPKVLHQILGRTILDYVIDNLRQAGIEDIVVVVAPGADDVRAAAPGCRFAEQAQRRGTGHALAAAAPAVGDFAGDLVVVPGDAPLLTPESLRRMIDEHRAEQREATLLSARLENPTGYGRVVRNGSGLRVVEELDAGPEEKKINECNAGAYVFAAPRIFSALGELRPDNQKGEIYLTDVLGLFARRGLPVGACSAAAASEIHGINTQEDLASAANLLGSRE